MKAGQHIVSLSLGTIAEPGAVLVIDPRTEFERRQDEDGEWGYDKENFYVVVGLQRFAAGEPYPAVAARISEIMSNQRLPKNSHLLLDTSLTGAAPVRVFKSVGLHPTQIELTNSGSEERSGEVNHVPVRDVIGAAQVAVQTNRLKVVSKLQHAETLATDLLAYDPQPMTRSLDLRGGRNSDLVHALAVALWWADDFTWGDWPRTGRQRGNPGPNAWMGT